MLDKLIRDSGLGRSITVLAPLPHERIPWILSRTAVLAHLPNWQEGLGGVILEAMAMRVPVVAFDSGGVAECFRDGISGFLVPQGDSLAAARKVAALIGDPDLRNEMGVRARTDLVEKFSYEKHFKEIENLYEAILTGGRNASAAQGEGAAHGTGRPL
jgi:glycosyltransferase involved in cell wall biosynthesis